LDDRKAPARAAKVPQSRFAIFDTDIAVAALGAVHVVRASRSDILKCQQHEFLHSGECAMKTQAELEAFQRQASEISISKQIEFQKTKKIYKDYCGYQDILCVFQTHNKAHILREVLGPFIKNEFKNIVLFADGCQDDTLLVASALLDGKRHAVIRVNDLHEVANYRNAINSEWAKECKYLLLMQDDDIYPDDFGWLDRAISIMEKDEKLVVIGFNLGMNYSFINPANDTFETDIAYYREDGTLGLPGSYEATFAKTSGNEDLVFQYCDCLNRAPNLIKISEFNNATSFDKRFEPFFDDDTNYCLELWSKGLRVGVLSGAPIYRNIGIGGMRLNGHLNKNKRPRHTKRNHNYLFEKFGEFINSGRLTQMVREANRAIVGLRPQREKASNFFLRRNQLCPCGSGKKYKHCHGALV
jgi:GT2 family glycosyltransferase